MQEKIKVNVPDGKLVRHPLTGIPVKSGDSVPASTYFIRKIKDGDLIEVSDNKTVLTKSKAKNEPTKVIEPKKSSSKKSAKDAEADKAEGDSPETNEETVG